MQSAPTDKGTKQQVDTVSINKNENDAWWDEYFWESFFFCLFYALISIILLYSSLSEQIDNTRQPIIV